MRPLEGIKVLDLTRLLPGPLATMYLADYRAEVIKIEDPFIGDYARDLEPKMEGIWGPISIGESREKKHDPEFANR